MSEAIPPGKEGRSGRRKRFTVDELFVDTRPQAAGVSDLTSAKEIALDRIEPEGAVGKAFHDPPDGVDKFVFLLLGEVEVSMTEESGPCIFA